MYHLLLFIIRRIRDELANQNAETTSLTNKLDRVSIASVAKKCFLLLGYPCNVCYRFHIFLGFLFLNPRKSMH